MFNNKPVSDSLIDAVNSVVSGLQEDAAGVELEVGDEVYVIEGNHDGMTGTIVEFPTMGRAVVQLDRGRRVTISNDDFVCEDTVIALLEEDDDEDNGKKKKKKLDPVGDEDEDIDNDGDSDESDEYLKNRRKTIGKAMKNEASSCGSSGKKKTYSEEEGCGCGHEGDCDCPASCSKCDCNEEVEYVDEGEASDNLVRKARGEKSDWQGTTPIQRRAGKKIRTSKGWKTGKAANMHLANRLDMDAREREAALKADSEADKEMGRGPVSRAVRKVARNVEIRNAQRGSRRRGDFTAGDELKSTGQRVKKRIKKLKDKIPVSVEVKRG